MGTPVLALREDAQVSYRRLHERGSAPEWVLSLVREGDVATRGEGGWLRARPGEVMLHSPGQPFVDRADGHGTHLYLRLWLARPVLPPTSAVVALPRVAAWTEGFAALLRWRAQPPGALRDLRVLALSAHLLSLVVERVGPVPADPVARVAGRLEQEPGRAWTRAELAALVHLHPAHLDRLFRTAHGVSALGFLRALRLERSRALLEAGGLGVAEVARLVGIPDPAYFSRTFRRRFGHPPGEHARSASRSARTSS